MANLLQSFIDRKISKYVLNKFNEAFFGTMTGGGTYTGYDTQADVYLEQGYLSNPIVYSIVNQRSGKAKQVPYFIKKVKDKKAKRELDNIKLSTKGILTPQQQFKSLVLKNKAFEDEYLDFPMDKPNTLQTWSDIIGLYETFMSVTGNFYLYMLKGEFDTKPLQVYVLPAHLMQIVLKPKADLLGMENPISHYMLIENNMGVKFEYNEVLHVKTPNPEYGTQGEHLYGLSPLRPAIRNIQSSNEGIDNNVRTMLNGGIFGFITGKNIALTPEQASAVKDTLSEMRSAKEHLSHVRGASSPLEFLKVSVDTEKLLPFAYQDFDQKQLCNVLGWDDKLLNNPDGAKYDNMAIAERRVLTSTVMPSLLMLQEKLNQDFIPLFKGYENATFEFDITEMPEMQEDIEKLVVWLDKALASGVINRDEYREAIKYPKLETPEMQAYTVSNDLIPLTEAINEMQIGETSINENLSKDAYYKNFNPNQPRDEMGRWTDSGIGDVPLINSKFPKITKDNFHKNTRGRFKRTENPNGEADFISRNKWGTVSSEYWYDEKGVFRRSDHWGNMKSVVWLIDDMPTGRYDMNGEVMLFDEPITGYISFAKLEQTTYRYRLAEDNYYQLRNSQSSNEDLEQALNELREARIIP